MRHFVARKWARRPFCIAFYSPYLRRQGSVPREESKLRPPLPAAARQWRRRKAEGGAYSDLLRRLAREGNVAGTWSVLDEMRSEGLELGVKAFSAALEAAKNRRDATQVEQALARMAEKGVRPDEIAWLQVLQTYVAVGNLQEARKVPKRAREAGVEPSAMLYTPLVQHSSASEAMAILREMQAKRIRMDRAILLQAMKVCAKEGDVKRARRVMAAMYPRGFARDRWARPAVAVLMRAFAEANDIPGGLETLHELGVRAQSAYDPLVSVRARVGDTEGASRVLDAMRSRKVAPSHGTYLKLVTAHLERGDFEAAHRIVEQDMPQAGVVPARTIFSTMLRSAVNRKDLRFAMDVVSRMLKAGVQPDEGMFSMMIKTHADAGDVPKSRAIVELLRQTGLKPSRETLKHMIRANSVIGDAAEAVNALEDMKKHGVEPCIECHNMVVHAFAVNGDAEAAKLYINQMPRAGVFPDLVSYNSLMSAYARRNDSSGLEGVLQEMQERSLVPDSSTYKIVLGLHASSGNVQNVVDTIEGMRSKVVVRAGGTDAALNRSLTGGRDAADVIRSEEQAALIRAYVASGDVEKAVAALLWRDDEDEDCAFDIRIYNRVLGLQVRKGDVAGAAKLIRRMEERRSPLPNAASYSFLIAGYLRAEELPRAEGIFERMLGLSMKPSILSVNALLREYAKQGRRDKFRKLEASLKTMAIQPDEVTYVTLLQEQRRSGDVDGLIVTVTEILQMKAPIDARLATAIFYAFRDVFDERLEPVLASALKHLEERPWQNPDRHAYNIALECFAKYGKERACEVLMHHMINDAKISPTGRTLQAIEGFPSLARRFRRAPRRSRGIPP